MSDLYVSQEPDFVEPSDIAKSRANKFSVIDAVRKIDKDKSSITEMSEDDKSSIPKEIPACVA